MTSNYWNQCTRCGHDRARAELRPMLEAILGAVDAAIEQTGDDRETLPAPELAGGTTA